MVLPKKDAFSPWARLILLLAFVVSGLAGLLFELVWTRLLLLSIGTSAASFGVVLGAFMGGMAIGSAVGGMRFVARCNPVYFFAGLEAWIGVYALFSPLLLRMVGNLSMRPAQFAFAMALLLPATVAMGASLPVLARVLARDQKRPAVAIGLLYAANTAGGVLAPLLAVFVFFPSFGLNLTLFAGATLNLLVAITLWMLRRHFPRSKAPALSATESALVPWTLIVAVTVSGASAMVYEVAWSRTLSMVYGSSLYGISIMLSTFLFGISIGSALTSVWIRHRPMRKPFLRLTQALVTSASLAFVSLILAQSLPVLFLNLYTSVQGTTAIFVSQFIVAALLMLPSTLILGATLPIAVLALPSTAADIGQQVARLYQWNLTGAALGAIGASILLLSSLGLELSVRLVAVGTIGTALILIYKSPKFSMLTSAFSASIALVILALDPGGEQALKNFGVYSNVRTYSRFEPTELRSLLAAHQLLYYRDGPTATVAVQQIDRFRLLKINGKTDASNGPGDTQTQRLLGHLPFIAADPRHVAVVGWGSGMTVSAVLEHPVSSVRAFEIEPAVVEASQFFNDETGDPLSDERVELIMGDARNSLRQQDVTYDLIINEPSNPWLTGVSNLFTKNFFEIMADRLTPDGIVCQWIHLYGMTQNSTRSLIRTFRDVFPHVVIFKDRDLIMLGSRQPLELSMRRLKAFFEKPGIRKSLTAADVQYPADILVTLRLDEDGAYAFSEGAPLNTDDNMRIELAAPKSLYRDRVETILTQMSQYSASIFKHLVDFDSRAGVELEIAASLFTTGRKELALDYALRAVQMSPSFESQKLLGQVFESLSRKTEARAALRKALAAGGGDSSERRFVEAMLRSLGPPAGS